MKRWTKKGIETFSDREFLLSVLNERLDSLTNCYSPLYVIMRKLQDKEDIDEVDSILTETRKS